MDTIFPISTGHILKSFLRNMSVEKPVENAIRGKLTENLSPTYLEIMNESYMHNVKPGSETHFKLVLASEQFTGVPNIKVCGIFFEKTFC